MFRWTLTSRALRAGDESRRKPGGRELAAAGGPGTGPRQHDLARGHGDIALPAELDVIGRAAADREHRLDEGRVRGEGAGEATALLPGHDPTWILGRVGFLDVEPDVLVVSGLGGPEVGVPRDDHAAANAWGDGRRQVGGIDILPGRPIVGLEPILLLAHRRLDAGATYRDQLGPQRGW